MPLLGEAFQKAGLISVIDLRRIQQEVDTIKRPDPKKLRRMQDATRRTGRVTEEIDLSKFFDMTEIAKVLPPGVLAAARKRANDAVNNITDEQAYLFSLGAREYMQAHWKGDIIDGVPPSDIQRDGMIAGALLAEARPLSGQEVILAILRYRLKITKMLRTTHGMTMLLFGPDAKR